MDTLQIHKKLENLANQSGGGKILDPVGIVIINGKRVGYEVGRLTGKNLQKIYSKIETDVEETNRTLFYRKISPYIKNEGYSIYYALV